MKKLVYFNEAIMCMANLGKRRTGLSVVIWSDYQGVLRNKSDHLPRVKIDYGDVSVSVSIEAEPKVLAPKSYPKSFKKDATRAIEEGMEYVGRNYDLFLKHYMDTTGDFDDQDLFDALRERGEFR